MAKHSHRGSRRSHSHRKYHFHHRLYHRDMYTVGERMDFLMFIVALAMICAPLIIEWYLLDAFIPDLLETYNITFVSSDTVIAGILSFFGIPYVAIALHYYFKWAAFANY